MEEMVELRYTGAQLRFAFPLRLQQDARPRHLYEKYESALLKDYLDRGKPLKLAQNELRAVLRDKLEEVGQDYETSGLPALHFDSATQRLPLLERHKIRAQHC